MPAVFAGLVFVLIFVVYTNDKIYSQNLVPDPSFEDYFECPFSTLTNTGHVIECLNFWMPPGYIRTGTPDYWNTCSYTEIPHNQSANIAYVKNNFRQQPRTGNGSIMMILFDGLDTLNAFCNIEYIQVKLKKKLEILKKYCL